MTVYVDDMRRPAQIGRGRPARWSHLMADTHDELMQAALDLGLNPEWIQHEGTHREHFDVTETVRQRAIAQGVAEATSYPHGTGRILAQKRTALAVPVVGRSFDPGSDFPPDGATIVTTQGRATFRDGSLPGWYMADGRYARAFDSIGQLLAKPWAASERVVEQMP